MWVAVGEWTEAALKAQHRLEEWRAATAIWRDQRGHGWAKQPCPGVIRPGSQVSVKPLADATAMVLPFFDAFDAEDATTTAVSPYNLGH